MSAPLYRPLRILCTLVGWGTLWGICASAQAGTNTQAEEPVPLTVVATDESYVFASAFNHTDSGRGDAFHSSLDFTQRAALGGAWFFQAGLSAERYAFGVGKNSPLPSSLESFNFPIGIVNITQGDIGFTAQVRPGFYFENAVTGGAFDIPLELGGDLPLIDEKLYIAWGLRAAMLQRYPIMPFPGLIWVINPKLILYGNLPEPRLEYTPSERLTLWTGGEYIDGTYKMDSGTGERYSGTPVEYSELRAGMGLAFIPAKGWNVKLATGYVLKRTFDFYRADQSYVSAPTAYLRLQVSREF